ncbi:hypothetical protein [Tunturiibacter gelidiferens]|uniref:Uncharacterized protein n=1 Tax=Tunturiibacter gelidiferens TaxID=3069689 RepID=A0AAU7Z3Y0_9BACT
MTHAAAVKSRSSCQQEDAAKCNINRKDLHPYLDEQFSTVGFGEHVTIEIAIAKVVQRTRRNSSGVLANKSIL